MPENIIPEDMGRSSVDNIEAEVHVTLLPSFNIHAQRLQAVVRGGFIETGLL